MTIQTNLLGRRVMVQGIEEEGTIVGLWERDIELVYVILDDEGLISELAATRFKVLPIVVPRVPEPKPIYGTMF